MDLKEGILLRWCTLDMLDRLPLNPSLGNLIRRHAARHPAAGGRPDNVRLLRDEAPEGTELHMVGVRLYLQDEDGGVLFGLRHLDAKFAPNE
ncbi:hypothetical protein POF50_017340 [Streptomyces sp. SL13]|uniref:Uncharacterized protein n=1 Tax=Streptantibioticus silvisoli TaxID=2705255 RepID=A0AA90H617_9ACTN|nr:hypothetical protein [Streptantibioticus silvisoli]MDI5971087.1 hypothetical protein [Streptantibioticus silvisoli]